MYRTAPLLAVVLLLTACGGGGSSSAGSSDVTTSPAGGGAVIKAQTGGEAKASARPGGCEARLGDFVDRMDDLRQALLAGLNYSEYVVRVKAIRDAYEAVPVKKLGLSCVDGAASEAEDAFNQYLRAANLWGECAGTAGCAASSIEGRLQRRWRIASKSLEKAERS
ncbi:MAG: hypothetical protein QM729_19030 [Solirubrobacterales bacterium]